MLVGSVPTLKAFQVLVIFVIILYYMQEDMGVIMAYDFCILSKQVKLLFSITINFTITPQQYPGNYSGPERKEWSWCPAPTCLCAQ